MYVFIRELSCVLISSSTQSLLVFRRQNNTIMWEYSIIANVQLEKRFEFYPYNLQSYDLRQVN